MDDLTGYYNTQERKFYTVVSLVRGRPAACLEPPLPCWLLYALPSQQEKTRACWRRASLLPVASSAHAPVLPPLLPALSLPQGREVCGFPRIVHGGLTAAIVDESFGAMLFALKQAKALPFWGPAYTVQLEVSYKSKIEAGRTILCTTELDPASEGRKLWMTATVR